MFPRADRRLDLSGGWCAVCTVLGPGSRRGSDDGENKVSEVSDGGEGEAARGSAGRVWRGGAGVGDEIRLCFRAGDGFGAGDFAKFREQRDGVGTAFDGPRLDSIRAVGDAVGGQIQRGQESLFTR